MLFGVIVAGQCCLVSSLLGNVVRFLSSDRKIATEFNNYFLSVFTVEYVNNLPDPVVVHAGDILRSIDCNELGILNKLKDPKLV